MESSKTFDCTEFDYLKLEEEAEFVSQIRHFNIADSTIKDLLTDEFIAGAKWALKNYKYLIKHE